ncbi:MAG: hypothetical protein FIA99_08250 [Ruminiclostridium sp.]|nr:hypothetical protein [Ruminiclostridium sp.]
MEQTHNKTPENVKIEIELTKHQYDFIVMYSGLAKKSPERLFNRLLVASIHDIMGKVKQLPYTDNMKFAAFVTQCNSLNNGTTSTE